MMKSGRLQRGRLACWAALATLTLTGLPGQQAVRPKPPSAARKAFRNAEKAWRKKLMAQARSGYEAAVALYPDYEEAWCALGAMQAQEGEIAAARKSLHQAIRSDPKAVCPYLPLAVLEHGARDWSALVEATDQLLKLDSIDYPIAFLLKAAGHYNLGEYEEAEKAAREAESLDNRNYPKIWEVLGWTAVRRGNDVSAMAQFQKYLESAPGADGTDVVQAALRSLSARHPEIPKEELSSATFRVETNLALTPFQITPRRGQTLQDLKPEDIEVREDGVPQKAKLFEAGRSYQTGIPVEISLMFDAGGGMSSIAALTPYIFHTGLLDEYENVSIAIYWFGGGSIHYIKPTRDARALDQAMHAALALANDRVRLFGDIRDAVLTAAEGRPGAIRMVAVFSDALSRAEGDELDWLDAAKAAREHGVALYPVLIRAPQNTVSADKRTIAAARQWMADSRTAQRFAELAPETGGQSFLRPLADSVLPYLLKTLAKDVLQYTYVAGYYPEPSSKGTRSEVEVVLLNKDKGQLSGGKRVVVH